MNKKIERFKAILKTSIIGIVVNILLALSKLVIGSIANSLAIMSDGINNFADATSGLVTIIGTAFAGKAPDRKHPFGYGRIEYLTSIIISSIVLYAGLTTFIEAVKSIFSPEPSEYSVISLLVVAGAVIVKLVLSLYTQSVGKRINSDSLIASGKEAILDVVVSISTLIAALIYIAFSVSIENYLAAVIAIIIIKTGFELLKDTVSKLLGDAGDVETKKEVLDTIRSFEKVNSAHDLVLYDYGPDTLFGSVHVDVDDTLTAADFDKLTREITDAVLDNNSIYLTAVGIYSRNTNDEDIIAIREEMKSFALTLEGVKGFHGFYFDKKTKKASFDLVITFDVKDRRETYNAALKALSEKYPDYTFNVGMDMDLNEL